MLLKEFMNKELQEEEAEKARKIKEEMERARLARIEEEKKKKREEEERERKKKEEELERKRKAEMEAKRKKEEEEEKKREGEKKQAILDQERRDRELAMRLAQDEGQAQVVEEQNKIVQSTSNDKKNLAGYKFAELRDAINTSTDIQFIEACREEFHRRLKVYHLWKSKNRAANSAGTSQEQQRAPNSVVEHAHHATTVAQASRQVSQSQQEQRYFRIPFIRPQDRGLSPQQQKRGWWFAHFDGKFIARQMELHPGKPALLLVAGKDDMQLCELSLQATGLTHKKGAEILPDVFEQAWNANNGKRFLYEAILKKQARSTSATKALQAEMNKNKKKKKS